MRACPDNSIFSLHSPAMILFQMAALLWFSRPLRIANLSVLCLGLYIAWPSPVMVKLRSNDTVLSEPITEEAGSWVISIGFLVGTFSLAASAFLLDRIGRKKCIILSCFPRIGIGLIYTFATEVWMLLLGRAVSGACDMLTFAAVSTFASEIANKEVRGSLGTILQIVCSIGALISLSVGPFMSYVAFNVMITAIVVLVNIPLLFLPDSPYFLYSKGRNEEALKVLTIYRGSETIANEEIKEYALSTTDNQDKVSKKDLLKNRIFLKAVAIVLVIGIGIQVVGFNAVQFYLQTILESTQTSVMPEIASLIIGFIQLGASVCTSFVTDRFGRKPIFSVTLIGMAIGMFGLGTFFKLKEVLGEVNGVLNYVPIISLILVVFCYSAGPGSITWLLNCELFDGQTRAIGCSIGLISSSIFVFLTTKFFASVTLAIGPSTTYWGFCVSCVLLCVFILFCVPETKGRTFAEIQNILKGDKMRSVEENCNKE